jgi:uncharacterized protein (DUF302 family)
MELIFTEETDMHINTASAYALSLTLGVSFEDAIARVREVFKQEGFGVLAEINVQQALHEKIGQQIEPYTILGMCNPLLASRAIAAEPNIGVLLPCNVLVARRGDRTEVRAQDPLFMVPMTGNKALEPIAKEARERIDRALSHLKA